MSKVGIIVNLTKDANLKVTSSIVNWIEEKNQEVLLSEITASQLSRPELGYSLQDIYKQSDFVVVLGGDGTLLGVARQAAPHKTPILGVNMGHLGFITEVEVDDVFKGLERVLSNDYLIEERMMLEASVIKEGHEMEAFYCLNDVVITRGSLSRMVTLRTFIDENYVDTYRADGLVVSTPTGSTAYSLSAGGPIVSPGVRVVLLTPICPHSLNSRGIVVSDEECIRIEVVDNYQEVYLTVDGQQGYTMKSGDMVIIRKAPFAARLVKICQRSFYDVLRTKLKERSYQ
jgi:NAD+ kinase